MEAVRQGGRCVRSGVMDAAVTLCLFAVCRTAARVPCLWSVAGCRRTVVLDARVVLRENGAHDARRGDDGAHGQQHDARGHHGGGGGGVCVWCRSPRSLSVCLVLQLVLGGRFSLASSPLTGRSIRAAARSAAVRPAAPNRLRGGDRETNKKASTTRQTRGGEGKGGRTRLTLCVRSSSPRRCASSPSLLLPSSSLPVRRPVRVRVRVWSVGGRGRLVSSRLASLPACCCWSILRRRCILATRKHSDESDERTRGVSRRTRGMYDQ